jgi:hypothetical protein
VFVRSTGGAQLTAIGREFVATLAKMLKSHPEICLLTGVPNGLDTQTGINERIAEARGRCFGIDRLSSGVCSMSSEAIRQN